VGLKIVIVGGVAGGAGAAAKARRVNEAAEIVLFERGPYVSFANCGLPYYIGGEITDRRSLFLQTPESFWKRFRVRVKTGHEVLRVDPSARTVSVRELASGREFVEPYDKLVLAPGAGAIVPDAPGVRSSNVFTVKTVPDTDSIRAWLERPGMRRAVVVGAGFIGLEAAEALKNRGLEVTLVEKLPQVLPPLDADVAAFVSHHLEEKGVTVILGDGLKALHGDPASGEARPLDEGRPATEIELESGRRLPLDVAILSIGVRPELKLAREAGLAIGAAGGIVVDDRQRTSDPHIYAAGDAVEVTHLVTGRKTRIPLAGPANKQGRVAGANAAGGDMVFPGAMGTAIVECLGLTAAKTGLSEREAAASGLSAYVSYVHAGDHAGYYPGAEMLHIKLVAEKETGRLLGAQVVGTHGVDKRIDVLATALAARMRVTDLENLDLAYAPQFSSAKDPVVLAGFVASNALRKETRLITCDELRARLDRGDDLQVVDVRTPAEFESGALAGAKAIPVDDLRDRITELDPARETVVYCRVGLRGYVAARILEQHGFARVLNLTGGVLSCLSQVAPAARPR
jgi:NADPH-dependent 2,4-dienoyl-CoA reductase/sulfur reductase-like enzyme/rhodanese-related sulfurtransferase